MFFKDNSTKQGRDCAARESFEQRQSDMGSKNIYRLFRLFITKGKAERRGVFRPKGLFASFRGGSAEVV